MLCVETICVVRQLVAATETVVAITCIAVEPTSKFIATIVIIITVTSLVVIVARWLNGCSGPMRRRFTLFPFGHLPCSASYRTVEVISNVSQPVRPVGKPLMTESTGAIIAFEKLTSVTFQGDILFVVPAFEMVSKVLFPAQNIMADMTHPLLKVTPLVALPVSLENLWKCLPTTIRTFKGFWPT